MDGHVYCDVSRSASNTKFLLGEVFNISLLKANQDVSEAIRINYHRKIRYKFGGAEYLSFHNKFISTDIFFGAGI